MKMKSKIHCLGKKCLNEAFEKALSILGLCLDEKFSRWWNKVCLNDKRGHACVFYRDKRDDEPFEDPEFEIKARNLDNIPFAFLSKLGKIDAFGICIWDQNSTKYVPGQEISNPFAGMRLEEILVKLDLDALEK